MGLSMISRIRAAMLTALALFSFGIGASYVGALGFFCMAFGDGFAAVLGKRFGRRVLVGCCGKTLVGSATMLAVSFASCAVVLMAPPPFGAGGILGAPGGAFAGMSQQGCEAPGAVRQLAKGQQQRKPQHAAQMHGQHQAHDGRLAQGK